MSAQVEVEEVGGILEEEEEEEEVQMGFNKRVEHLQAWSFK